MAVGELERKPWGEGGKLVAHMYFEYFLNCYLFLLKMI
jgi:hypothetical protein